MALYGMAGLYQYLSRDPIIKHMVKCRYCRKKINEKVGKVCVCVCVCVLRKGVGGSQYREDLLSRTQVHREIKTGTTADTG